MMHEPICLRNITTASSSYVCICLLSIDVGDNVMLLVGVIFPERHPVRVTTAGVTMLCGFMYA